jgi:hypothetical protein
VKQGKVCIGGLKNYGRSSLSAESSGGGQYGAKARDERYGPTDVVAHRYVKPSISVIGINISKQCSISEAKDAANDSEGLSGPNSRSLSFFSSLEDEMCDGRKDLDRWDDSGNRMGRETF